MEKVNSVLCVFTRILGGKIFSKVLEGYVNSLGYSKVTYVDYDEEIFKKYHPPFYCRLSDALQSAWQINRKFKDNTPEEDIYEALFFQAYQLTIPFSRLIKKKYTVLSLDTTPLNAVRHSLKARTVIPYSRLNAGLTHLLNFLVYKRVFKNINMFLARTELVKASLINDYNISEDRVVVTYMPTEKIQKHVSERNSGRLNLLFIGNAWERKGGKFLLDVFNDKCAEVAHLTIVSTEERVKGLQQRLGITVINGLPHSDVISLMSQSDVLLFPSWRDELGLVLCEALSQGLAAMARESGAQGELVIDGVNGRIFSFSSTSEEWREAILGLAKDKDKLTTYKRNSLKLAEQKLSPSSFVEKLRLVFPPAD